MRTYWINIREDGTLNRSGIYTPTGTKVVARDAETITFKVPGHSYWRGLPPTPRGYAGVEYIVVKPIDGSPTSANHARVEVVASYSVREARAAGIAA